MRSKLCFAISNIKYRSNFLSAQVVRDDSVVGTLHFFSFNCHQSRARTTYPTRSAQGFGVAREPIRVRVVVVGDAHAT